MRVLRGLSGALLWIVASVVGLLAVVLCVTVILLPVGIPLLMVAKRMFGKSVGLLLPRGVFVVRAGHRVLHVLSRQPSPPSSLAHGTR